MRILITGSRLWRDKEAIRTVLSDLDGQTTEKVTLVSGGATGADACAEEVAYSLGWGVERHLADWDKHGKFAGPKRNMEMVDSGVDLCVAFPIGESKGTRGCMAYAEEKGVEVINFGKDK